MERAFVSAAKMVPFGLVASLGGFVIPETMSRLGTFLIQLVALVGLGLFATDRLAHFGDHLWLSDTNLKPRWRAFWTAGTIVAFSTGVVALATMASSATLRLVPSLQFLQLLSALDITWAGSALFLGVRWLAGRKAAWAAGISLGIFCVWSIWNYLTIVGLSPEGGWLVDQRALMKYVIPFDMAAAGIALIALWIGAGHFTAQRNPQS